MVPLLRRTFGKAPTKALILLLLVIGLFGVPRVEALKCFACDGEFGCIQSGPFQVKDCQGACFSAFAPTGVARGCAPKGMLHFHKKSGGNGDCFDSTGGIVETLNRQLCARFGEVDVRWPQIISMPGPICLCRDDFCNEGLPQWKVIIGTWEGGSCDRWTFREVLLEATFNWEVRRVNRTCPTCDNYLKDLKDKCTHGPSVFGDLVKVTRWVLMEFNVTTETIMPGVRTIGIGIVGVAAITVPCAILYSFLFN